MGAAAAAALGLWYYVSMNDGDSDGSDSDDDATSGTCQGVLGYFCGSERFQSYCLLNAFTLFLQMDLRLVKLSC